MSKDVTAKTEKVIEASSASVSSAQVYVKTVMIGNKQITQSVYKQIPELSEPLISWDLNLSARPWGWVNYHDDICAKKCSDYLAAHMKAVRSHLGFREPEHMHILCEKDNLLYKAVVFKMDRIERAEAYEKLQQHQDWRNLGISEGRRLLIDAIREEKSRIVFENRGAQQEHIGVMLAAWSMASEFLQFGISREDFAKNYANQWDEIRRLGQIYIAI